MNMTTRLAQDTKIAKGTKRAVIHNSVGTVGGSTTTLLTEIGGAQDSLEVRRDGQAHDAPQQNKDCKTNRPTDRPTHEHSTFDKQQRQSYSPYTQALTSKKGDGIERNIAKKFCIPWRGGFCCPLPRA